MARRTVTADEVEAMARALALPIDGERARELAPQLTALLQALESLEGFAPAEAEPDVTFAPER